MSDTARDDAAMAEPVFRSAKRRKVLRKRFSDSDGEAEESNTMPDDNAPSVLARRRPLVKKQGVPVSSAPRGIVAIPSSSNLETAVVPHIYDVAEQIQNERFMKPTGKAGVVEDKHMVAYVDAKLAELRSSNVTAEQSGQAEDQDVTIPRGNEQPRTTTNRATVGDVEEVDLSSRAGKSRKGVQTRQPAPSKRQRRLPTRGEDDIARDALVDQIMREPQVSLYDHSSTAQTFSNVGNTAEDGMDNDTAAAEAFKAQYYAQQEAQHRRRPPPPPAGKGAASTSTGPKLGGSRSQREKMKALEEASKGGTKKK